MARTSTIQKRGPLVSPFSIADEAAALVAHNNMPHAKRAGYKKPTKAQWHKKYAVGRAKWLADNPTGGKAAPVASVQGVDVLAQLASNGASAEVIALTAKALGIGNAAPVEVDPRVQQLVDAGIDEDQAYEILGIEPTGDTSDYESRKPKSAIPTDAARNAVLWALNTEGLLQEACEAASEDGLDYITQDKGQEILTAHFGPLPTRTA